MPYNFKKFEGRNARLESRITITKSNSIGFPTKFYVDNKIKDYKYVILFWDEQNQAIGVHFTNDEENRHEKDRFSVIHSNKNYGGSVVTRSFFKANNIDLEKYHGKYDWKIVDLEDYGHLYVIELKEGK
ncbi:MAG: hypothetical protein COW32_08840 [Candidatus Aquicultor secundus]|uniref:Uncharacterized protein n=1 Tax=Candidatus Aquicultor secundus TaxID=1973895 RepID=A0A2M7T6I0_9ACTN|nr:hypothetical protein [Candidatus Aquicultor secundus]PIU26118.1 MAG: hypothetical protein COT10_10345 [Candidatus Aquicultor secundus]PIW21641.1 MAG: hypothetical protein COW32_08840 [Candidatus Aquicultor secundus]PIZ36508.1 MAG: hypothetical protein COY37_08370 [Candidatus Aquicultor secundus]